MKVLKFRRKFKPPFRYFPYPKRPFETGAIWTLSFNELRVYSYLCWKIVGFGKDSDQISYKQMRYGIRDKDNRIVQAGLNLSERTLRRTVRKLETSGWIRSFRKSRTEPLYYEVLNPLLLEDSTGQTVGRSSAPSTGH